MPGNKRSMTFNLKHGKPEAVLMQLVAKVDVVGRNLGVGLESRASRGSRAAASALSIFGSLACAGDGQRVFRSDPLPPNLDTPSHTCLLTAYAAVCAPSRRG